MSDPHDFGPISAGTATDRGVGVQADLETVRLGVLLEIACDAIVAVDQDGVIVLVNERAEQLFGFARTELIGRPVEVLAAPHAPASHVLERAAYLADPQPRRAIITVTLDEVVTSWSAGAERMYGYDAEEAIGMPISLTHASSEQHEQLRGILKRVREGEVGADDLATTRRRKDGRVIEISLSAWPVHDRDGRVEGACMIAFEIAEREHAAAAVAEARALRERTEAMGVVLDGAPIGMAVARPDGRFERVNQAMCELLGR